ncbi:TonB-dependent receptor [Flagellimonas lutaonensis]|uniref:TonB-dependent receptor n=1 Tax=Flagellimonas lutaonensis TaxID=516051 RepID=A0A0D5YUA6_9FLAO|nr:TonB-dependent receptor [Allomuricauda lutaonensis]AKA35471.1 TonB-dependent receptor [Allomuricauda lutaonensis]
MLLTSYRINKIFWVLILAITANGHLFAQIATLRGSVLSSDKEPLANTNILAFPKNENEKTVFSISNQKGEFELKLKKDEAYLIRVSYLGYEELVFEYQALEDDVKNLIMTPKTNILDEVILEYRTPIEIKEDTITYQTDAFVTGKERKLREVLKKLPGIEVDREGNVTAQGKKVTKVLVEDKTFFTGNSKLAVNNIPADAVDQVQILDNYSEVGFLKGLQDSDEMAMNIKLKEDKKKFAFGDMELGGGIEDRYIVHPNVFYYSPKTNVNFIGDLNNTGVKSFTLSDYLEFNGGFGKLMGDMRGYLALANDNFSQFLLNNDFKANINRFAALNLRQSLSAKTDLNSFVITNASDTQTEVQTLNTYVSENPFDEDRTVTNALDNFFIIGKLTLDYEPSLDADLAANTFAKITHNDNLGTILTQSPQQNNTFTTLSNIDGLDLKQNLEYSKRFSRAQTLSLETTLAHQKNRPNTNWLTDVAFLQELIPLQEDVLFDILQQKETQTTSFDLVLKDYWVLNNFNHVYTTAGTNLVFEEYETHEVQRLTDGSINDFSDNGFGNALDYRFNDTFLGLEYKFLTGIFTVKSGLFYHYYDWRNTQFGSKVNNATNALLPEFSAEAEFNNSEKIRFRYRPRLRFPRSNRLVGNFLLNSFNSVLLGNAFLQNERFHSYSLTYYKFSLFRGLNLNTGLFYNRKTQSIKNTTALDGIEQFVTYTMFNEPENSLTANFNFSKRIGAVKLGLDSRGNYNEFFQLVNGSVSKNISRSLSITGKMETFFEKWPNLELGYTHEPSKYLTNTSTNIFINQEFFANLDYSFFNDFHLKADYRRTDYENEGQNLTNTFDLANASLFYQKEDSPWGFEISATNLLNTQFKRQNSFSDFLISDQTTFIIPRIVMFKISYKL